MPHQVWRLPQGRGQSQRSVLKTCIAVPPTLVGRAEQVLKCVQVRKPNGT